MFDVFDLVAKITLDSDDYERKLNKAKGSASTIGSKIGGAMKTAGAISTAALGAAAAGVVALTKQSVDAFANYEQLVGGVQTLYKEDAYKIQQLADDAYRTAGLSANAYMEQATSMAAALVNSLGGDTEKAVKYADTAITDMSDNANKMGTDMEAIQNAYNGFSKGNFTMLDNLKLGFGGTKEEMQRLLEKASEISGFEYDISSYSDIVQAIHVVQEEMGITGTTMDEAGRTISGSLGMVKGAWENLITAFGRGGDETRVATQNLINSVETYLNNLIPVVSNILLQMANAVPTLIPMIAEKLPGMAAEFLPKVISTAASIITSLVSSIPNMLTQLWDAAMTSAMSVDWLGLGTQIWETIKTAFLSLGAWYKEKFEEAVALVKEIDWAGLGSDIWTWITEHLGKAGEGIGAWFKEKFDEAVAFVNGIDWPALGNSIWNGITGAIGKISEVASESGVAGWFKEKFEAAKSAVLSINWVGLGEALWDLVVLGIGKTVEWFTTTFTQAKEAIEKIDWEKLGNDMWDLVKKAFTSAVDYFLKLFTGTRNTIKNDIDWEALGKAIRDYILAAFNAIADTFKGIWEGVKDTIHDIDWSQLGKDILDFIVNAFNNVADTLATLWEAAKTAVHDIDWAGLGSDIWDFIVGAIGSPVEGIAGWFKFKFDEAKDWIKNIDWAGVGAAIWEGIKSAFTGVLDFFTDLFDFSNIHIKFPHFTVTSWWEPGFGIRVPWSWGVEWYRKAYDQPWLFNKPASVGNFGFGDGGRSGELVYGHDSLMRDIREATNGNSGTINITLNAYQNIDENTEQFAQRVGEIISEQYNRQEAAFA